MSGRGDNVTLVDVGWIRFGWLDDCLVGRLACWLVRWLVGFYGVFFEC